MTFKAGDIIKLHNWHGVVLKVFRSDDGGAVLYVHTLRNVFRGYPPEYVEVDLAPEGIQSATRADLEQELQKLSQVREAALDAFWAAIDAPASEPVATNAD